MNDFSGTPVRPALRLVPDEPDQIPRLQDYRMQHPGAIIGTDEFGNWTCRIPEPNGETFITRYTLRELLDKLDSLLTAGSDPG